MKDAQGQQASSLEAVRHGQTCQKVSHDTRGGYLHDEADDSPYDVDGVSYCGRCHECLPEFQRLSVLEWAEERLANTERIAELKRGADRDGWLEDAAYWAEIVLILRVWKAH